MTSALSGEASPSLPAFRFILNLLSVTNNMSAPVAPSEGPLSHPINTIQPL